MLSHKGCRKRLFSLQAWCNKITDEIRKELGSDYDLCEVATEFERISACVEHLKEMMED